jgi:hypothetical protein
MRLGDGDNAITLHVVGYQFPDAEDPRKRYSWHDIAGCARDRTGAWAFRGPWLACDETPRVSGWLRQAAAWLDEAPASRPEPPAPIRFTDPNLQFAVAPSGETPTLCVGLDLEFRPPWARDRRGAGWPYNLYVPISAEHVRQAADDWDLDLDLYPDLYPYPSGRPDA